MDAFSRKQTITHPRGPGATPCCSSPASITQNSEWGRCLVVLYLDVDDGVLVEIEWLARDEGRSKQTRPIIMRARSIFRLQRERGEGEPRPRITFVGWPNYVCVDVFGWEDKTRERRGLTAGPTGKLGLVI